MSSIEASHERHKTRKVFELLFEDPAIADLYPSKRERESLRKRLERSRKFVLLTEVFSISILFASMSNSRSLYISILETLIEGTARSY